MKKLLLSLLITLISSTFAFSQSKVIDYSSKIPTELKVKYSSQLNIKTFSEYSRKHEGTIVVEVCKEDGSYKMISVQLVKSTFAKVNQLTENSGCEDGYRSCARGCNDKPTSTGVILCLAYCMIDCSGS